MGRNLDWKQKVPSRINVPYELAHTPGQKKALTEIWQILQEGGFDLTHIAFKLKQVGLELISQDESFRSNEGSKLYRRYSAAVAASFGVVSASDADAGGYEEAHLENILGIKSPERTIFLEVTGYSMIDDGIFPGAVLTVETRDTTMSKSWLDAQSGNTVIALIDKVDFTVKKFQRTDEGEFLVPRNRKNKNFQRIQISSRNPSWIGGHEVEIFGIVTKISLDP